MIMIMMTPCEPGLGVFIGVIKNTKLQYFVYVTELENHIIRPFIICSLHGLSP